MRLLITGAGGMLGADVVLAANRAGHEPVALPHGQLDITDPVGLRERFDAVRPDWVVNCAAWTDVDGAESQSELAHAVNEFGAGNIATLAGVRAVPMLHVSTDYVFNGAAPVTASGRPRSFIERDPTGPRSVYGQSKLAGEQRVLGASPLHTVVRTSWLFGVGGANFVATMLRLADERDAVQVVDDQVGCPTWTGHLAPALIGLLERQVRGIVHLAGSGSVTWNGFAREIFRQAERDCQVQVASTEQMGRPAPRPAFSAIESERDDVLPLPPWQDGLAGYLAARAGMMRA